MDELHPFARKALPKESRVLYKFRSFDKEHPEYLSRIFTHRELYFPRPSELNDPFEFKLAITPPDLSTEKAKFSAERELYELFRRNGETVAESRRRAKYGFVPEFMTKHTAIIMKSIHEANEEYRICSFSGNWNSLHLWSHYANAHTGICLLFNADNDDFGSAMKVRYSKDYPTVGVFDRNPYTLLKLTALTKSEVWGNEDEYRLITKHPPVDVMLPVKNHIYTFETERLQGVMMGCRIKPEDEKIIRDLAAGYPKPLQILRVNPSSIKYGFELLAA